MMLARSGVGSADDLRALEITPVVDLPGVGRNLSDHPLLSVDLPTRPSPGPSRFQTHLSLHSDAANPAGPPDLLLFCAGPFAMGKDESPGGAVFGIVGGVMAPRSRGWVRLASTDPREQPRIHSAHLEDGSDLERLLDAVGEAHRLARSQPVGAIVAGPELSPAPAVMADARAALAEWARSAVSTYHHPVGTCAIGADPDEGAVTDARGSAHGVDGLTVSDAAVMRTIPAATTNLPTIMLAEQFVRWLRSV